jgi:hypothetical protein
MRLGEGLGQHDSLRAAAPAGARVQGDAVERASRPRGRAAACGPAAAWRLPRSSRAGTLLRVALDPRMWPSPMTQHAVGHAGDGGVVRDHHAVVPSSRGCARWPRARARRWRRRARRSARRTAARRALGDGARDRHALLLAAGELRREVVAPRPRPTSPSASSMLHRVARDVGHELRRSRARSGSGSGCRTGTRSRRGRAGSG